MSDQDHAAVLDCMRVNVDTPGLAGRTEEDALAAGADALREVETLRRELAESKAECERLRAEVYIPNIEECPTCGYVYHGVHRGPCPNDSSKMNPVLWKDKALLDQKLFVEESKKRETLESELAESKARIARLERRLRVAGKATD